MTVEERQAAVSALTDPLQKASAEEAPERGDLFVRDGVFVPMLAGSFGITDEQLDESMARATQLPVQFLFGFRTAKQPN